MFHYYLYRAASDRGSVFVAQVLHFELSPFTKTFQKEGFSDSSLDSLVTRFRVLYSSEELHRLRQNSPFQPERASQAPIITFSFQRSHAAAINPQQGLIRNLPLNFPQRLYCLEKLADLRQDIKYRSLSFGTDAEDHHVILRYPTPSNHPLVSEDGHWIEFLGLV